MMVMSLSAEQQQWEPTDPVNAESTRSRSKNARGEMLATQYQNVDEVNRRKTDAAAAADFDETQRLKEHTAAKERERERERGKENSFGLSMSNRDEPRRGGSGRSSPTPSYGRGRGGVGEEEQDLADWTISAPRAQAPTPMDSPTASPRVVDDPLPARQLQVSACAWDCCNGTFYLMPTQYNSRPAWSNEQQEAEAVRLLFYSQEKSRWFISDTFEDDGFLEAPEDALLPNGLQWTKGVPNGDGLTYVEAMR